MRPPRRRTAVGLGLMLALVFIAVFEMLERHILKVLSP